MSDSADERYAALQAAYRALDGPPEGLEVAPAFEYIRFKALAFLSHGPDVYRANDALGRPPASLPELRLDAIRAGCRQVLDWWGLTPERPLQEIGVDGFYALLRVFHFEAAGHATLEAAQPDHVIDQMDMRHVVQGTELRLFNLVKLRGSTDAKPSAPCPLCGAPLRTARAKQCRSCGADWHDRGN